MMVYFVQSITSTRAAVTLLVLILLSGVVYTLDSLKMHNGSCCGRFGEEQCSRGMA